MTKQDASKIWNYMQRFPLYDDLKELNNKFLPELAKLEQSIENFKLELEKVREIMRSFDATIARKSNKEQWDLLNDKVET